MTDRLPWRVGRKVGRTIYQQIGPGPSDDDVLIGVMDTPELAYEAVSAHNFMWRTLGYGNEETEVCPQCGTASCLEDARCTWWYDRTEHPS